MTAKGALLTKVHPPNCAAVDAVMLSKKQRRSSTVQEEGLTNESRHHLLLLHKQARDKRDIAESLHAQITGSGETGNDGNGNGNGNENGNSFAVLQLLAVLAPRSCSPL